MSRVLVIDDEAVIGDVLRYAFRANGHQTVFADDGDAGLEVAREQRPDAIVLDLIMPRRNGYDVLDDLRHDAAMQDVPVLILTAVTLSRDLNRCLAFGADRVMTKPFDPRDVADAIDELLTSTAEGPEPAA